MATCLQIGLGAEWDLFSFSFWEKSRAVSCCWHGAWAEIGPNLITDSESGTPLPKGHPRILRSPPTLPPDSSPWTPSPAMSAATADRGKELADPPSSDGIFVGQSDLDPVNSWGKVRTREQRAVLSPFCCWSVIIYSPLINDHHGSVHF